MKIKRVTKKSSISSPALAALILQLTTVPQEELSSVLLPIINSGWSWTRTDLQHWISPLNRFDDILDQVVKDYDLGSMELGQTNQFTPRTRDLVLSILGFQKLLLENSTNRKIFSGFDRLNDLLHTTDIPILLATLRLALRPAQQFSTQNQNQSSSFGVSSSRLLNLAQGWGTRDYGLEMVDLASEEELVLPPELDEAEWQFYRKAESGSGKSATAGKGKEAIEGGGAMEVEDAPSVPEPTTSTSSTSTAAVASTPARPRPTFAHTPSHLSTPTPHTPSPLNSTTDSAPVEGLTTIPLGSLRTPPLSTKPAIDILLDLSSTYSVPVESRLSLLQKIRIQQSLSTPKDRQQLLIIRLLSLALLAHTISESSLQTKLFLYEPELVQSLSELVHPDRKVPIDVQSAAFYALDAIAKVKSKIQEVAASLNASVSHGILMYVLRKTRKDLEGDHLETTNEFVDALFGLLGFFQTNSFVGNMIVGAGVTGTLVEFGKMRRRDRIGVVTKAIVFLDSLMYGYSSAFNLFISIGGLAVFVDRIKDEVELCIEAHSSIASTSKTPIDSPTGLLSFEQSGLLKALLRAIQRLMQTAGTTEGLRNVIDTSLLGSVKKVIQNREIFGPQLFGLAITITATFVHNEPTCLTTVQEAGVPEALYDAIEESIPASIDVLQAIPNAIGALLLNPTGLTQFNTRSIIPHYFSIFSSPKHVKVLQERDHAMMVGTSIDELIRHHPSLKDKVLEGIMGALAKVKELGEEWKEEESEEGYGLKVAGAEEEKEEKKEEKDVEMGEAGEEKKDGEKKEDVKENHVMTCVDVIGRFLEGLFQSPNHCKDFVKLDPFATILDLFALPCVPHISQNTPAFVSMSTLFRIMSEVKPTEVVAAVLKQVKTYLKLNEDVWKGWEKESRLVGWLTPTPETLESQNLKFRHFSALLSYLSLMYEMFSNLIYSHGKIATLLLSALAAPSESQTLADLGQLYKVAVWENLLLKKRAASEGEKEGEPKLPKKNLKALQEVVGLIPQQIAPFLQSATKMFVHRRSADSTHRRASSEVAKAIATIMKSSVEWPDSEVLTNDLAYSTLMMGFVSNLLFDERSSSAGIQTILLVAFEKAGGLKAFLDLYARYQTLAGDLVSTSSDNSTQVEVGLPIVHVFGGLRIALDLLLRLSSQRSLFEAPQTTLLLTREKDKTSPDFFDPHEFIISIRGQILSAITVTWDTPWLAKSPPNVVRNLVGTFVNILRAEGESASDTPAPTSSSAGILGSLPFGLGGFGADRGADRLGALGGLAGLGGLGGGREGGGTPLVVDEERIAQLTDMGFPRTAARTALTRCRNNVAIAAEYLLQHPDIVGAARIAEQEAAAAAPAANEEPAAPPAVEEAPAEVAPPALLDVEIPAANAEETPAEEVVPSTSTSDELPAPVVDETPASTSEATTSASSQDVEMGDETSVPAASTSKPEEESKPVESTAKAAKAALDEGRAQIKPKFLEKSLKLAEEYPDLVFDIKGAYTYLYPTGDDKSAPSLTPIIISLADTDGEVGIATRLRLLALLTTDAIFRESLESSRERLMEVLMGYQRKYIASRPAADSRPKWLAPITLIADSLFSLSEVPKPVEIIPEGGELPSIELVAQGPAWSDEREGFFELALDMLEKGANERDSFISSLRLLLVLTRDNALAVRFAQRNGLKTLLSALAVERPETTGCHPFASMLIRHIIEDDATLRPLMVREIETWFAQARNKVADVTTFLRAIGPIAFRNVPIFLDAVRSTCKLVRADSSTHYHIALQNEPQPASKAVEPETIRSPISEEAPATSTDVAMEESTTLTKPSKPSPPSTSAPAPTASTEAVVQLLMSDALDTSKIVLAVEPSSTSPKPSAPAEPIPAVPAPAIDAPATGGATTDEADAVAPELPASIEPNSNEFTQLSFSLASLAELLSSYSSCKTSFLAFSTRRSPKDALATPSTTSTAPKSKSSFLYYLLNDIIPVSSVVNPTDLQSKRKAAMSLWASLVVVSLCSDPEASVSSKDSAADITAIRKSVLDAISRAFKDATTSSEPTEVRYGRLFALSDLCYRLLTARPYPHVTKPNDETSMQMAKLMLEKNFAVTLTNALADVDLNFPSVNNLINSILRPLEQLTKVVTKVGRSKSSSAAPARGLGVNDSSSESSMDEDDSEVDTEEEEEQEEAPDLYRNSALGIYEGELEPAAEDWDGYSDGSGSEGDEDEMMEELGDEGLVPGSDISDVSEDDEEAFIEDDEIEMVDELHTDSDGDGSTEDDEDQDELEMREEEEQAADALMDALANGDDEENWEDEDEERDEDEDGEPNRAAGGAGAAGIFDHGPGGGGALRDEDDGNETEDSFEEDDVLINGELEFDADDIDQLNALTGGGQPFGWDPLSTGDASRRNRSLEDFMGDGAIFGGRSRATQAPVTPVHPLLVDNLTSDPQLNTASSRRQRRGTGGGPSSTEYNAWAASIERALGAGSVDALQELLSSYGIDQLAAPEQIRLVGPGPDGRIAMVVDRHAAGHAGGLGSRARHHHLSLPRTSSRQTSGLSMSQFLPVTTSQRWQEESRIEAGSVITSERVARLVNHLINVLHPAARDAARVAQEKEKEEAARLEVAAEEKRAKAAAEREVADREAAEAASASTAAMEVEEPATEDPMEQEDSTEDAMEGVTMQDDIAEVIRLANSLAAGFGAPPAPSSSTPAPTTLSAEPTIEASTSGEENDESEEAEELAGAEASGSGSAERVMIMVDGQEFDITDSGIDPTFLEALPDDMRREVLNQHFREARSAAPPPVPAAPSQINSEFLDALPPDLRAEVLRQEAADQRREQAAARAATAAAGGAAPAAASGGPVDLDPATFFATLDPELRDAVLLEQEDGFLSTLPANLLAEANLLRQAGGRRPRMSANRLPNGAGAVPPIVTAAKKAPVHREAIQLLEKSGLATLVRLLFFPQPLRKNVLQKVLVNLCENSRTRMDLINLLLTILQDGTRDVSAVDKSFSQMSLRASKSLTTKDTPRKKVGLETPGGALPQFPGESVPNLIAQRCLEALMYLMSNEQSSLFFLTEQEVVVGLSRRQSKKGKGKEKATPSVVFPIVILLGLLDRPTLLKTPSMMDSLTSLLANVTKTLSVLQRKPGDSTPPTAETSTSIAPPASDVANPTPATTETAPPSTTTPAEAPSSAGEAAAPKDAPKDAKDALTADVLVKSPPQIPPAVLRLVVNVLDAGECSSKTFQQTIALIQNLSYLPGARDIILDELKARAQRISGELLPDLDELLQAIEGGLDVRGLTLAKFSPAGSLQAKLLRILKTIDHYSAKKSNLAEGPSVGPKKLSEEEERVLEIYDSFSFGDLWDRLGKCLAAAEENTELSYIGNVLLPLIEAVMVVSKFIGRRPAPKDAQSPAAAPMSPSLTREADPFSTEGMFLKFTEDHRRTINQLVRSNPGLMSGSFAVLAKNSTILDFDTKRNFFFSRLHDRSLRQRNHYGTLQINVRRQYVFEDSFHTFVRKTGDEIKHGKLSVKFYNEEGVDAGGVTREWFSVLARQMFNPGYALFQPQAADALTYQPNKSSSINDEHLAFFQFVGRIIGKALHDQRILEAYFSRAVYKHMLGKPVDHKDLESIDPEYHKSLVWMLENDIDGVLDLTFSVERDDFGVNEIVDLVPDGRNVAVTNENKAEYVRLIADQRLSIEIKDQMDAMLKGLYDIVPKDLLQIFSEQELELLISGLPDIDVDEWRANTELHNFTPSHPVIGYFWRAVRSFTMEERAKLLQFVSGSSRVPLEGFGALQGMSGVTKFSITSAGDTAALPTAHTCFNQLDLPASYESYEALRKALLTAIHEGADGFGFA